MPDNHWFIPETYEDFRILATNSNLSAYEKIGFPDEYRVEYELAIFHDITAKLVMFAKPGGKILDIGPGISELPRLLITKALDNNSEIYLVDSPEMLELLPSSRNIHKIPGKFPEILSTANNLVGKFDAILMYSVLQYIAIDSSLLRAIDTALDLMAPGGQFLIGDIPNLSMRQRFFSSENGIRFHQNFMKTSDEPIIEPYDYPKNSLDDSVIFSILSRARSRGFHAYCLPQAKDLPFANRREDILIERP